MNVKRFLTLGLSICLTLAAQYPPPGQTDTPANSNQTQRQQSSPTGSPATRPCGPTQYGDPYPDCYPTTNRSPYNTNNPYSITDPNTGQPYDPNMEVDLEGRPIYDDNGLRPTNPADGGNRNPLYYRPERPSEFQRYVSESTGSMLPLFGASLFERIPATFAPVERVPVSADYLIAPGDELQIAVWGQFNLSRRLIVNRNGEVILPDAGPVSVTGMTYTRAAAVLKSAMARLYKNFDVSVTLGRLHTIQIFVVGEARRPGSYTVSSLTTLVNAVFVSGGPSTRGTMRQIQLKRGSQVIKTFDLYQLLIHGDKSDDAQLAPGDVIFIPSAGPRVAVAGSVEHPAIFEVKPNATVADALEMAGGLSPLASTRELVLERVGESQNAGALRLPVSGDGLKKELQNGDILRLLSVVPRFDNTVALRGNVADPGKFPWRQGMHLSDLIPAKEALLTRDYWRERSLLARPERPKPLVDYRSKERLAEQQSSQTATPSDMTGQNNTGDPLINGTLRNNSTNGQPPLPLNTLNRNSQNDPSSPTSAASTDSDSDAVPEPRRFRPHNFVDPVAPDINWDYAVVERIDKETLAHRLIPFNLGKLVLKHDPSQDLALQPGDVVTIFSMADFSVSVTQQVKQVRLEGEIAMAGTYTVSPGETLRQLVARAGGLSDKAYLYGAQFTRESTRKEQQKRYHDFLDQFEREINEAASNLSSRVTTAQQAATAQTSLVGQHDLIDRLRKMAMTGRIVLDMDPESGGAVALPDLELEDGDRLFVPSRPSTVNVIGAVAEQAAFLRQTDLRTGDYLKKAGGVTRAADRSHMFVVRADGSVVSRTHTALFAKSFDGLNMFPVTRSLSHIHQQSNLHTQLHGMVAGLQQPAPWCRSHQRAALKG